LILEVQHITKSFDGMKAINDLSLGFVEGELNCIIGPNGSGKSTLFNIITGYFPPTSGKVIYNGKDITSLSAYKISRMGICRKFQNPNIFGELTVEDNLRVAAIDPVHIFQLFRKKDESEIQKLIEEVLEKIELSHRREWKAASLSHGEKQWLEIGMVLIKKPKIILLDEPTAGMTRQETAKTSELIRSIGSSATVIVVEHDLDFIRSLNGRIVVLNRGEFLAEGSYDVIAANKQVRDVYLGDET
jgi:urea transport system ATP-binding protein